MENTSENSNAIAVEKQKTLRLLITTIALLLLAGVGFFVVLRGTEQGGTGKVDVDFTAGKLSLSLEKPLVEQANVGTARTQGSSTEIRFTEGKIKNQEAVDQIAQLGAASPTGFAGKNFISNELRCLFSVAHPDRWQVSYNPAGLQNSMVPVYTIFNQEGSHLNIGVGPVFPGMTIQQFVDANVQAMLQVGGIAQPPQVTYDFPSETAFAVFTNPMTGGQSYQKVIINRARNQVLIASANYNQLLSNPEGIQDLISMIATFTLF